MQFGSKQNFQKLMLYLTITIRNEIQRQFKWNRLIKTCFVYERDILNYYHRLWNSNASTRSNLWRLINIYHKIWCSRISIFCVHKSYLWLCTMMSWNSIETFYQFLKSSSKTSSFNFGTIWSTSIVAWFIKNILFWQHFWASFLEVLSLLVRDFLANMLVCWWNFNCELQFNA